MLKIRLPLIPSRKNLILPRMTANQTKIAKVVSTLAVFSYFGHSLLEFPLAKSASSASIQAWVIDQTSSEAGPVLSEISQNAIRINLAKYGWVFIARAPDWSLLFLNEKTKNFVELSKEQWKGKFLLLQSNNSRKSNDKIDFLSKPTGKMMKIANLEAIEYVVERALSSSANERVAEVWTSLDIQAPPPVVEVISKLTHLPDCKGIPLKAYWRSNDKMTPVLETIGIKQRAVPRSIFEQGKDWLKVQDQLQVMFGQPAGRIAKDLPNPDKVEPEVPMPAKFSKYVD